MLATNALSQLTQALEAAVGTMNLRESTFGLAHLVERQANEAERTFQGYLKAGPRAEDAYAAALALLRGRELDAWQRDVVASALSTPIKEQNGVIALGSKAFQSLLKEYEREAQNGDLWRLTWNGLLCSYLTYDPAHHGDKSNRDGWLELRAFLNRSWPKIEKSCNSDFVPRWVAVLRYEPDVLTEAPVKRYATEYLAGEVNAIKALAEDLGIPQASWFWHELVLGAVRQATQFNDESFREAIPRLIELIRSRPVFRDEAIELILNRYYECADTTQDKLLRDFVIDASVWKNPKLREAGIATAWHRVPDAVWQMVLSWVNEANLKEFFEILAARNQADEGRLAFWTKYLKQIQWTRLVFGAETMALKSRDKGVRDLIAREEGAYAALTKKTGVDAFMMQLGSYVIIEFSKKPNACYVYKANELPFEPYQKYYTGGTEDLAVGLSGDFATRIVHTPGWEARAHQSLLQLGIEPDVKSTVQRVRAASRAVGESKPDVDIDALRALVSKFAGAHMRDGRSNGRGRLWVNDPRQHQGLAKELKSRGFKWSTNYDGWYYAE